MEVLRAFIRNAERTAVCGAYAATRYYDLIAKALQAASAIKSSPETRHFPSNPQSGPRVAIMAPPGREYVESTLGAWLAGAIAVPLCLSHPQRELQYVMEDAQVSVVLCHPEYAEGAKQLCSLAGAALHLTEEEAHPCVSGAQATEAFATDTERLRADNGSLIIYTSGTTGRPKGVLHTHRSIDAQVAGLCSSWEWRAGDRILHALPLHHIHGIVNALFCPLAAGAAVEFMPKFSPAEAWKRLKRRQAPVSVFMGVPTMYSYLLSAYDGMGSGEQEAARAAASRLRLAVSGSAACPVPIMQRWEVIAGERLLERYGMTETGMLLSNPYRGERRAGFVGLPLPGVEVKTREDGELAVRGSTLFREYWGRPEATAESFDEDGYFLTGDTVSCEGEPPYWRILGRTSADIIKCRGYKISALQIEDALLAHPHVSQCAVLGVPDATLGERIVAVVSSNDGEASEEGVIAHAEQRLPRYQVPGAVIVLDDIPRNAMGKVNKKALRSQLFPDS